MEWGIFNDEAEDWSSAQSVECGFDTREEAEAAIRERYTPDDELTAHEIEEPDEDDDEDDPEDDDARYPDPVEE